MINITKDVDKMVRKAHAAYVRQWRKKNPEKVKEINMRYWIKKAIELEKEDSK